MLSKILIFAFWPFASFMYGISQIGKNNSKFIFAAFGFYVGYTLVPTGDLLSYSIENSTLYSDFLSILSDIFNFKIGKPIVYLVNSIFLNLGFTDNFLFGFYFGIFTYLTIDMSFVFLHRFKIIFKHELTAYVLLFIFLNLHSVKLFYNMAFFLGATFFLNGFIKYINSGNLRFLIVSIVGVLFHFGLLPLLVILVLYFSTKKTWFVTSTVLLSLFSSNLGRTVLDNSVGQNVDKESNYVNVKYHAYGSQSAVERSKEFYDKRKESFNIKLKLADFFEMSLSKFMIPVSVLIVSIVLVLGQFAFEDVFTRNVYHLTLWLFSLCNLMADVSQGWRFLLLPMYLMGVFIIGTMLKSDKRFLRLWGIIVGFLSFSYSFIWLVAFISQNLSWKLIFSNLIVELVLN